MKDHVPITARTKRFPLKKGKSTVIAARKKLSEVLGLVITVYMSQGSTPDYIQGDLNGSTIRR